MSETKEKREGKHRRHERHPKRANVELFLAARNLPNRDLVSKTDPFTEVFLKTVGISKEERSLGKTEIVRDNLEPRWAKSFVVEYCFERVQLLRFQIWDYDGKKKKEQFVGRASCELGQIMGAKGQALSLELETEETKGSKTSSLTLSKTGSKLGAAITSASKKPEILIFADKVGAHVQAEDTGIKGYSHERLSSMEVVELEQLLAATPKEVKRIDQSLRLEWSGENLAAMDIGGSSDPFITISIQRKTGSSQDGKVTETGFAVQVFKSEIVKKNLNPKWAPLEIALEKLCNNNLDSSLLIQCWDWDRVGSDELIGGFSISAKALTEATLGQPFDLIHEAKKAKSSNYTNSGRILINSVTLSSKETDVPNKAIPLLEGLIQKKKEGDSGAEGLHDDFVRYLAGGCELSIIFGIDFTGSNRRYDAPSSLHSLAGPSPNPYQQVIKVVGHIVQHYSHDKKFPAYGYAAGIAPSGKTLPAFNLRGFVEGHDKKIGDPLDLKPPCHGIDHVLKSYEAAVPKLTFGDMGQVHKEDGKTVYKGDDFYQLIDIAMKERGECTQEKQRYTLLLLVIDGDYVDMKSTTDAIVKAGHLPLSIVIIGVGNNDFINCIALDADESHLVSSSGEKACRDVVQFVKYNDHKADVEALGAKVLEELPTQFVEYMRMKGYNPNPRERQDL